MTKPELADAWNQNKKSYKRAKRILKFMAYAQADYPTPKAAARLKRVEEGLQEVLAKLK